MDAPSSTVGSSSKEDRWFILDDYADGKLCLFNLHAREFLSLENSQVSSVRGCEAGLIKVEGVSLQEFAEGTYSIRSSAGSIYLTDSIS